MLRPTIFSYPKSFLASLYGKSESPKWIPSAPVFRTKSTLSFIMKVTLCFFVISLNLMASLSLVEKDLSFSLYWTILTPAEIAWSVSEKIS